MTRSPESLLRPYIRDIVPYTPGEQIDRSGVLKLNTNENPYPPAPEVLSAVRDAVDQRLRLYPNPTSAALRAELAKVHGVDPENVLVGNGSDEILALAIRAFVEPSTGTEDGASDRSLVQYFDPSYSLYPVLCEAAGVVAHPVPLADDFDIPSEDELTHGERWRPDAALTFVTTPNAPSGRGYSTERLRWLCAEVRGAVFLDEAYVDFADEDAACLASEFPHVLVGRTFSKSYSLCFQRVGYVIGHPTLIQGLDKIRDSYNVNGLGQLAALETLRHLAYYREGRDAICEQRSRLIERLRPLGFESLPSSTNFILTRPTVGSAKQWFEALRARDILVRWFSSPRVAAFLRITIGSPEEMDRLIEGMTAIRQELS